MAEEWRSLTDVDHQDFWDWVGMQMLEGRKRGKESYPKPVFQGDPLDHAIEEAVDELFYLRYIQRQRDEERAYTERLRDVLWLFVQHGHGDDACLSRARDVLGEEQA